MTQPTQSKCAMLFFSILFACSSEKGVTTFNATPEATITSHSDGSTLLEGYTVTLMGTVTDNNHSYDQLTATWKSGTLELCPPTTPESDGATLCEVLITEDMTEFSLQAQDPQNATGLTTIGITVTPTEPPAILINAPMDTDKYYSDQSILFSATVSDAEDNAEDLTVTLESNLDGQLLMTATPDNTGFLEQYISLSEGQHAISATVEDSSGKTAKEMVAIAVGGPNKMPLCGIDSPTDSAAYIIGQNVSFSGTAIDEDVDNSTLSISWESNQEGVFNTTSANTAGELSFSYDGLSADNHIITLRVEDEVGGLCTDTVQIVVGNPPQLNLTAPVDGAVATLNTAVSFEATVSDTEDIPSDIDLNWVSNIDGSFSTQGANSNGNIDFSTTSLSAGIHSITVTATDTSGLTDSANLLLTVNTPPTAPTVSITPSSPLTGDSLVATASGSTDVDGQSVTYEYAWYQNGNPTSYLSSTVPSTATTVGEQWTVRVTPNDGYTDGSFTESSVVVINSPPTVDSIGITPNTAVYNDTVLTCTASVSDADETVSATYEWTVNGLSYTGNALDLATTNAMPTDSVTCTATVTDSTGATDSQSSSTVIDNRAPTVSGATVVPTVVYTTTTASCSASGSDLDEETVSLSTEWSVGGNSIGSGDTLDLTNLVNVGDVLTCTVTGTDGYGISSTDSIDVTISNTDPVIDSLTLTPSAPNAIETLTCSAIASDVDGGTPTLSFSWENVTTGDLYSSTNSTAVSATLDLSLETILPSDEIACTVTADDTDGGNSSDMAVVTVANSAPIFDVAASISPSTGVVTGTTLTCSATASDIDDGLLTPDFEWTVGGLQVGTGASFSLNRNNTDVGDTVVCTATASDNNGEVVYSNDEVLVENTPPTISDATITPTTVYNDTTASCTGTIVEPDEVINEQYEWYVNGLFVTNGSVLDLSNTNTMPEDTVECVIYAEDSQEASVTSSVSVTVENRVPIISNLSLSPTLIYNDTVVVCNGSISDAEEQVTPSFEWISDGQVIGTGAEIDLATTATLPEDELTCRVSVSDSYLGVNTATISSTVLNRTPIIQSVTISPNQPVAGIDDVSCTADAIDPDGELISLSYEWEESNGLTYSGSTLPASLTSGEEVWTCIATVNDSQFQSIETAAVTIESPATCAYGDCDYFLDLGNGLVMDFNRIPAGDDPLGRYTLTKDFFMMTTEVTQGMFQEIMGYEAHDGNSPTFGYGSELPAYYISWNMAADFANSVTSLHNLVNGTALQPCYNCVGSGTNVTCTEIGHPNECTGYALPTEGEWEYAARSGTTSEFWTGEGPDLGGMYSANVCDTNVTIEDGVNNPFLGDYSWNCSNSGNQVQDVATKLPNGFGLFDIQGNVYEWTADAHNCAYPADSVDPWCNVGSYYNNRGGGVAGSIFSLKISIRWYYGKSTRITIGGIRLVRHADNSAPTAPGITLKPSDPKEGIHDIICDITTPSIDNDGDTINYNIAWIVDGQNHIGQTVDTYLPGDTIPRTETIEGQTWECTVIPNDGSDNGPSTSQSVTVSESVDCYAALGATELDIGAGELITFNLIPACNDPLERYSLSNDFYLMRTEVTQEMFQQVMGFDSRDGKTTNYGDGPVYPAYYVSWHMAAAFANALTQIHNSNLGTSLQNCYTCSGSGNNVDCIPNEIPNQCTGYILPTEAEWEYAARSGTTSAFWTGAGTELGGLNISNGCGNEVDDNSVLIQDGLNNPALGDYAWFCGNRYDNIDYNTSKSVGSKLSNGFGLFDMHGNIKEWTNDLNGCSYPNSVFDPMCNSGTENVIRGGGFISSPNELKSSERDWELSTTRNGDFGFRILRHDHQSLP